MTTATATPGSQPQELSSRARFATELSQLAERIDTTIGTFLDAKKADAAQTAPDAEVLVEHVADLIEAGGKRLRPALVYHAYRAVGGRDESAVLPLAAATELLHAYLLLHDDIMDNAELRRGRPSAWASFRDKHRTNGWRGEPGEYGRSVAILVGDLAASYAFELFAQIPPTSPSWRELERCFAATCQEVIHGQFLEIRASYRGAESEEELRRVLQLKSGRYTVERPIQLGALLGEASPATRQALADYGLAVGEAFQLQDDVLGLFGDSDTVGKPVGSDLTEGKYTFLIHYALEKASPEDRELLEAVRGNAEASADDEARGREIVESSGALDRVKAMIGQRLDRARGHLDESGLGAEGRRFFDGLIDFLRHREH